MTIDVALRWLCACLAPSARFSNGDLAAWTQHPAFDWDRVLKFAHSGYVATQLYPALCRRGLVDAVPAEWCDHLRELSQLNAQRNGLLWRELAEATRLFNRQGLEPVFLKGALALQPGQPAEFAVRFMGDIDLLLPAESVEDCQQLLQDQRGYIPAPPAEIWEHCHHAAPLLHPRHGGKFELHRAIFSGAQARIIGADEAIRHSQAAEQATLRWRVLCPTHRALHSVAHSFEGMICGSDLRSFYDFVRLREAAEEQLDWQFLYDRLNRMDCGAYLDTCLLLARELFNQPLPSARRWRDTVNYGSVLFGQRKVAGVRFSAHLRTFRYRWVSFVSAGH